MLSLYSISKCCTASLSSRGKKVGLACANWRRICSSSSLASSSAYGLRNNSIVAFLLYLAAMWRSARFFLLFALVSALQLSKNSATAVFLHDTVVCESVSLSKPLAQVSALC